MVLAGVSDTRSVSEPQATFLVIHSSQLVILHNVNLGTLPSEATFYCLKLLRPGNGVNSLNLTHLLRRATLNVSKAQIPP